METVGITLYLLHVYNRLSTAKSLISEWTHSGCASVGGGRGGGTIEVFGCFVIVRKPPFELNIFCVLATEDLMAVKCI